MEPKDYQAMVREFHEKFRLTASRTPALSPADDLLRINLIHEEASELWEAQTHPEAADAYADLAYVIYGAGVTYGLNLEPWVNEEVSSSSAVHGLIFAGNGLFALALANRSLRLVRDALCTLLGALVYGAESEQIPLTDVFREVHRSNLTKLWTAAEIDNLPPAGTAWVVADQSEERRYLVKRADGKVLKSPSYSPADIAGVLKNVA